MDVAIVVILKLGMKKDFAQLTHQSVAVNVRSLRAPEVFISKRVSFFFIFTCTFMTKFQVEKDCFNSMDLKYSNI